MQNLWRELKRQEKENVEKLKRQVTEEVNNGCF